MQWDEEGPPPLLVKIAPDLSRDDMEDIARVGKFSNIILLFSFSFSFQILNMYPYFRLLLLYGSMDWYVLPETFYILWDLKMAFDIVYMDTYMYGILNLFCKFTC